MPLLPKLVLTLVLGWFLQLFNWPGATTLYEALVKKRLPGYIHIVCDEAYAGLTNECTSADTI
jgi:hypothetical protein